jgi:hypothetical protein
MVYSTSQACFKLIYSIVWHNDDQMDPSAAIDVVPAYRDGLQSIVGRQLYTRPLSCHLQNPRSAIRLAGLWDRNGGRW